MSSAAASVRRSKERRPEDYCADPRCLWRTRIYIHGGPEYVIKPCPKHPTRET